MAQSYRLLTLVTLLSVCSHRDADGDSAESALFGGMPAAESPPIALVGPSCSGVLVHRRLVVYAAHCGPATLVTIEGVALATDRCEALPSGGELGSDLAYCLLAVEAEIERQRLAIPATGCELEAVRPGEPLILHGRGLPERAELSAGVRISQSGTMIVVAAPGVGACGGDSGGPAFAELSSGLLSVQRLVGIISSGQEGCSEASVVLTPIAPHLPWLEARTGLELTPCGRADGSWEPTPDCTAKVATAADLENSTATAPWDYCGLPAAARVDDATPPEVVLRIDATGLPSGLVDVLPSVDALDTGSGVREVSLSVADDENTRVVSRARSIPPYGFPRLQLAPGSYSFRATATDYTGNEAVHQENIDIGAYVEAPGCTMPRGDGARSVGGVALLGLAAWRLRRRSGLGRNRRRSPHSAGVGRTR